MINRLFEFTGNLHYRILTPLGAFFTTRLCHPKT